MQTIGIIGGMGWIGSSLGRALIETGRLDPERLCILNRAGTTGSYFGHKVQWARDVADLVARSETIVVSVRPQDWPGLRLDPQGKLVISVMAGVPLAHLPPRTIRALPNAAAELRQSFSPWFAASGVSEDDRRHVGDILSAIGTCDAVESEHHLDLMTATVGAGPAYSALLARAIIGFLVEGGVRPALAERAAEGMICGAAPLLAGRMDQVSQTLQTFMDYKGTTAAGLESCLRAGVETALRAGFQAATDRAEAMSKEL